MKNIFLPAALLYVLVSETLGQSMLNAACANDADCDSTNTMLKCMMKKYPKECTKSGKCMCQDGYEWDTNKCKMFVDYNGNCDNTDDTKMCRKNVGLSCTNSKCVCASGMMYKTAVSMCTNKKFLTEDCAGDADCYDISTMVCSSQKCACKDKLIADGTTKCRKPRQGEPCRSNDDCAVPVENGGKLVCTNGTCECESALKSYTYSSTIMQYACVLGKTGGFKIAGETCSSNADCEGYTYCGKCMPSDPKKCLTLAGYMAPTDGTPSQAVTSWISLALMVVLQLLVH